MQVMSRMRFEKLLGKLTCLSVQSWLTFITKAVGKKVYSENLDCFPKSFQYVLKQIQKDFLKLPQ